MTWMVVFGVGRTETLYDDHGLRVDGTGGGGGTGLFRRTDRPGGGGAAALSVAGAGGLSVAIICRERAVRLYRRCDGPADLRRARITPTASPSRRRPVGRGIRIRTRTTTSYLTRLNFSTRTADRSDTRRRPTRRPDSGSGKIRIVLPWRGSAWSCCEQMDHARVSRTSSRFGSGWTCGRALSKADLSSRGKRFLLRPVAIRRWI